MKVIIFTYEKYLYDYVVFKTMCQTEYASQQENVN